MMGRITRFGSMLPIRLGAVLLLAAVMAAAAAEWGHAQTPQRALAPSSPATTDASRPTPQTPRILPPDEFGRLTPRGTIQGFLSATDARDYGRAAAYLDLSRLPVAEAAQRGPTLARHLRVVLDQILPLDPTEFSDEPEGILHDGQPLAREVVGRIETKKGGVTLFLDRVPGEDGVPVWKVAAGTAARIPGMYAEFGHGPMGEFLPPMFVEVRLLEIALWQWIALLCLVPVSLLLAWILVALGLWLIHDLSRRARFPVALQIAQGVAAPTRLLIAVAVFHAARRALSLALAVHPAFATVEEMLAVVAVTWLLLRVVAVGGGSVRQDMQGQVHESKIAVADLAQRALTLLVVLLGFFALLEVLGVHVTALIAGLGVGGIALALAAQKTVEHLFGGASLVADQPVQVGDFCRFGDQIGTVELIGLRSTRVRTLARTVVSIPNGEFASMQIENFAKRDRIWLQTTVRLRYDTTSDQVRHVLVRVRELLCAHPMIYPDPPRVRLVDLGPYALELEIFAYVRTQDYNEFLAVREDIYLRIMDIVAESATGFALPSQTIYRGSDGLDPDRARAVEAEVRRWRADGTLPMPEFPPERLAELRDTLDYPPNGSPAQQRRTASTGRG
jgi:MscS family membrane protein